MNNCHGFPYLLVGTIAGMSGNVCVFDVQMYKCANMQMNGEGFNLLPTELAY